MNDVMKKRVIGAIVLVILGILLPLLLARCLHDGDSGESASTRVYEITPDGNARPAGAGDQSTAADNASSTQAGKRDNIDGSSGVRDAREDTPPPPQRVSPAARDEAPESADGALPFETPPVRGNASNEDRSTPAPAKPTPTAPPSTTSGNAGSDDSLRRTESASGGWVVQVASFGDENNARRLAAQLNADYKAFYRAGSVGGKTWYRVRIGPFESESQARSTAAKLRQQGRSTLVQRAE
ncbi:hypothetical protein GCM10028792_31820 [Salinisphaera aquimarina]